MVSTGTELTVQIYSCLWFLVVAPTSTSTSTSTSELLLSANVLLLLICSCLWLLTIGSDISACELVLLVVLTFTGTSSSGSTPAGGSYSWQWQKLIILLKVYWYCINNYPGHRGNELCALVFDHRCHNVCWVRKLVCYVIPSADYYAILHSAILAGCLLCLIEVFFRE